jgi:hypothetical protein
MTLLTAKSSSPVSGVRWTEPESDNRTCWLLFAEEAFGRSTTPRAHPLGDREDDFSELLALFEAPVSLSRFGQGEDTIDHRPQPLFADELQNRE